MEINGKVYRNLPQQVLKNQEDILALKGQTVDAYTKAESDAKFETKEVHQADFDALNSETDTLNQQMATANTDINNLKKVSGTQETAIRTLQADVERIDPIVPTDIAVHEGKLGLEHNTTWLTNQNAITLGDGLTYDEATKTLKAEGSGATLPAGTSDDPFVLNYVYDHEYDGLIYHGIDNRTIVFKIKNFSHSLSLSFLSSQIQYYSQINSGKASFSFKIADNSFNSSELLLYTAGTKLHYILDSSSSINSESYLYVPSLERPESDGSYNLQITKTGSS